MPDNIQDIKPMQPSGPLPFTMQEGEAIYAEVKPERTGYILSNMIGTTIVTLFIILCFTITYLITNNSILWDLVIIVVSLAIGLISPLISYGKFKYWITNHRVVGQRGFIGYSVESIPLENVTDVTISRGMIEQLLSLSSLYIVPIGAMYGGRAGGGVNYFPALKPDHAVELQSMLFKLRDARKKEMGKTL
jgi:uncharacterized membrane protein YdbT with pleckstrin-like domain